METTAKRAATTERATPKERAARGKSLRGAVPRSSHGDWEPARRRPNPVKLLTRFATTYADQNERDHRSLVDAIEAGKVPAEAGL